jgi:hypothetical protein
LITITNISKQYDAKGEQEYELAVVGRRDGEYYTTVISRFTHTRSDGLAECLRKATAAAERAEIERFIDACEM